MTTATDDATVENAFEAYLAGRPVAAEGAGVAAFAEAVRATATAPGRPNAALAELLATGLLVDQPSPSSRTARSPRRRRITMFFPALIAKILSAGAVAQAATGAGIAVVVVTSAGAAGVLPDPVQETFSTIVGTTEESPAPEEPVVTPPAESEAPVSEAPVSEAPVAESPETEAPESGEVEGPDPDQPFGQWVNGRVEHGYVDGRRVSEWAHERNERRRAGETAAPETEAPEVEAPETEAPEVEDGDDTAGATTQDGDRAKKGNGRGHDG